MNLEERLKTPVTVDVTQEDIDTGLRGCTWGCPIAKAVNRAIGGADVVHAQLASLVVGEGNDRFVASMPEEGTRFIRQFDAPDVSALPVVSPVPFSFELQFEKWKEWYWLHGKTVKGAHHEEPNDHTAA
jgi:hypothetical protein